MEFKTITGSIRQVEERYKELYGRDYSCLFFKERGILPMDRDGTKPKKSGS